MSLIASTEPILAGAPAFQDGEQPSLQKTVLVGTVLAVCSGLTCLVTLSSINVNVVQSAYAPVAVPQGTSQTISKAPMKGPARLYNAAARMSLLQPSGSKLCWNTQGTGHTGYAQGTYCGTQAPQTVLSFFTKTHTNVYIPRNVK